MGNQAEDVGDGSIHVVSTEIHSQEDLQQPDEENQLIAIPAKGPGKSHADQVIEFDSKLTSQRVAASNSIQKVLKYIDGLKKDIRSGHKLGGSLIKGQVDQIEKYKQHAIEAADAIYGNVFNIKEAI